MFNAINKNTKYSLLLVRYYIQNTKIILQSMTDPKKGYNTNENIFNNNRRKTEERLKRHTCK